MKLWGTLLLLALLSSRAGANTSTAFASNDPGVRATAMGGAYTGLGGDPGALYWNPATLFFQTHRSIEASYSDLYGLGLAKRTFFTYGSKHVIDEVHYEGDQVVVRQNRTSGIAYALGLESLFLDVDDNGYSELSLGGGVAWGYGDRFAVGLALRGLFASSDIEDVSGSGYNLGLGVAWKASSRDRIGLDVPHLFSRVFWKFDSTERLPIDASLGWSRRMFRNVTVSADLELREGTSGLYRAAAGAEWWVFPDRLAIRGGFRHVTGGLEDIDQPTFGAAMRLSRLRFDYAYRFEPDALGDTHRLGLAVDF
jgi:hypothetical protein